jgi:G3E family GTPase
MDDDIRQRYQIQGIVTVVDALHITPHLDESPEAARQVAFADLLLINKVDLVGPLALAELQVRLKRINAVAPQVETQMAEFPLDRLWDLPGFRLDRALSIDEAFLSVERPFESALPLPPGSERFTLKATPGADPTALALLLLGETSDPNAADTLFQVGGVVDAEILTPGVLTRVPLDGRPLVVDRGTNLGGWIYFEHHPEEFDLRLFQGDQEHPWSGARFFRPNHEHDDVTSVGLTSTRPMDPGKFQRWLRELLAVKGNDIYRSKGVLYMRGSKTKQIFQGVHMLLTGGDLGPWGQETPETRMVFIGRNLDRKALTLGFERCLD